MTSEEMERMVQFITEQQVRTGEQQARTDENLARTDEHLARMSERQARTDEQLAFIAEQNAATSQTLAKLTLDITALTANVEKNSADIARNAVGIESLKDGFKEMRATLGLVVRMVDIQAKLQDENTAQIKQLTERQAQTDAQLATLSTHLGELAGIVKQYATQSRNGDRPNQGD